MTVITAEEDWMIEAMYHSLNSQHLRAIGADRDEEGKVIAVFHNGKRYGGFGDANAAEFFIRRFKLEGAEIKRVVDDSSSLKM